MDEESLRIREPPHTNPKRHNTTHRHRTRVETHEVDCRTHFHFIGYVLALQTTLIGAIPVVCLLLTGSDTQHTRPSDYRLNRTFFVWAMISASTPFILLTLEPVRKDIALAASHLCWKLFDCMTACSERLLKIPNTYSLTVFFVLTLMVLILMFAIDQDARFNIAVWTY